MDFEKAWNLRIVEANKDTSESAVVVIEFVSPEHGNGYATIGVLSYEETADTIKSIVRNAWYTLCRDKMYMLDSITGISVQRTDVKSICHRYQNEYSA